ncbi:MAG TPA: T9SS type A sorting domain-containing protein [Chitinophagales bacterium]|nr:T9SS type A sorting domain-containing protein [Chitinophagales bacterium]
MKHNSLTRKIGKNITCPLFSQSILFLFVLFSAGQASAQAIASYSFAQTNGGYLQAGLGSSLTSSGCYDDAGFSSITLPFTFTYHGTAFTTVGAGPNGIAQLGGSGGLGYSAICSGTVNVLSPLNANLYGCVASGGDFSYVTAGATPNRVLIMQWSKWGFYNSGLNEFSFQIKLYETSNTIQFIYKDGFGTNSGTAYVGLTGATSNDFQGRKTTTNWAATTAAVTTCASTCTINSSVRPTNGLTFTWTSAGTVAAMGFSQSTTTYVQVVAGSSSTSFTASGCYDDSGFSSGTIPFTFIYHGSSFTTFGMSPNGYAQLGASGTLSYSAICSGLNNVLSPLNSNLDGCTSVNGDASYTTIGTTPNRTLIIQWENWGFSNSGLNEFSFEIKLYETTNVIDFVYGPSPGTSSGNAYVGLTGATSSDFQGRTTTTSWFATSASGSACGSTCGITSSIRPGKGLTFTWTPPACSDPTVNVSPTSTTMCPGDPAITLTASGTATSYTWTPAAGLNITTGASVTAIPSATTTYTVTGTSVVCTATATSLITVNMAPTAQQATISAAGPTTFCKGQNVVLTVATDGLIYQWKKGSNDISGATMQSYTATKAATYKCVVSNSCGMITSNSIAVTVNPIPTASVSSAPCSGGAVLLTCAFTPGSGVTFQWKKGTTILSGATNSTFSATSNGTYKCTVTITATGCTKLSDGVQVTINCKTSDMVSNNALVVYPNPASDYFNINTAQLDPTSVIYIYDLTGRLVESHEINGCEMKVGESLSNGVYFLKIASRNQAQQVVKLVKNF